MQNVNQLTRLERLRLEALNQAINLACFRSMSEDELLATARTFERFVVEANESSPARGN